MKYISIPAIIKQPKKRRGKFSMKFSLTPKSDIRKSSAIYDEVVEKMMWTNPDNDYHAFPKIGDL